MHRVCEFYKLFHEYLKLFPKTEKYSLGQTTENLILKILEILLEAVYSSQQEKLSLLTRLDRKTKVLKIIIRLANEAKALDDKKYLVLEEKLQEIGRMLGGWIRSIRAPD